MLNRTYRLPAGDADDRLAFYTARLFRPFMWITGVFTFVVALAYMAHGAFVARASYPLHGDETFFASCAARGIADGEFVMSGCTDNKGPVIYVIHQLVARLGGVYELVPLKLAAFALLLIIAASSAATARRLGTGLAIPLTLGVFGLAVASHPTSLSLNTDTVGTVLTVLSCLVLVQWRWLINTRALVAGVLLGLALLSKQTFAAFALPAWMFLLASARRGPQADWKAWLGSTAVFGAGTLLPIACFSFYFSLHGELLSFLDSLLLYPSLYGLSVEGSALRNIAYRISSFVELINESTLLFLCLPAAGIVLWQRAGEHGNSRQLTLGRRLLVGNVVVALLLLLASPVFAPRLAITFFAFAGAAIGACGAQLIGSGLPARPSQGTRFVAIVIAFFTAVALVNVWRNNGVERGGDHTYQVQAVPEVAGKFGYIYGVWAQFYFVNRMIPASDVLYATAFDGHVMPDSFALPKKGTARAAWFERSARRNEERLMEDFARTPPAYIAIGAQQVPANETSLRSGVDSLDHYVETRCSYVRAIEPPRLSYIRYSAIGLFQCR